MTAATLAAQLVADLEGFRADPYQCEAGVWTIGFGTTRIGGKPVTQDTPSVTREQASRLVTDDMRTRMEQVDSLVRVVLTDNQKAALYSFAYNVGVTAFRDSTMLRKINAGQLEAAAEEFPRWVYDRGAVSRGLKNRRIKERALFLTPE